MWAHDGECRGREAMVGLLVGIILLVVSGPVMAQEASLVDILQAKGVLSKKEAQKLKKGKGEVGGYNQQALVNLLQEKGILTGSDLAQLQAPATTTTSTSTAAAPPSPEVTQWLTHLESRQAELQAQSQAQADEYKRTAVADVKKNIDWLSRFSFSGDMRNRFEGIDQSKGPNATARNRERLRLRFGVTAKVTDEVLAGFRLVSGDPNDPISNMQTLGDAFTKKPISLDQAYITVTPK